MLVKTKSVKLSTLVNIDSGFSFKTPDILTDGKYPVLKISNFSSGIIKPENFFINVEPENFNRKSIISSNEIIVAMSGSTGKAAINDGNTYYVNQRIAILRNKDENIVLTGYLKHHLVNQKFETYCNNLGTGLQKNISNKIIGNYEIPLPELEVQKEIVEILDKFTTLEEELESELEAREKQYKYYLNKLTNNLANFKMMKVSDFADVKIGATPRTSNKEYWKNGVIPWMSSGEIHNKIITKTEKFITERGFENTSTFMLPKDTVLVALAGQGITRGNVAITGIELCTNQSIAGLINKRPEIVNSKFVYYFLKTQYENLRFISSGDGTRGGLNSIMIRNYQIPIPLFEEQNKIVDILDKFSALVENIEKGLPREIELRRKQYEYYRNKLLTFEEL